MKVIGLLVLMFAAIGSLQAAAADRPSLSHSSSTEAISKFRAFPEPIIPAVANPSQEQNAALVASLNRFMARTRGDDFSEIEAFAASHPDSPWLFSVLTNVGLIQFRAGYFSRSLESFRRAWQLGKTASNPDAKPLVDRAGGEYAKLLARVGLQEEIDSFLAEAGARHFVGPASELLSAAREGRSLMQDRPEIAFRCGPLALATILRHTGRLNESVKVQEATSTARGVSLAELQQLSARWGMGMQAAKRMPGAAVVTPSVVHWKIGHYAALLSPSGDGYLSKDPTFENDTLHSIEALEDECSGYFLVPMGKLPVGWIAVGLDEANTVFGKGATSGNDPIATRPTDAKNGGNQDGDCRGMAGYAFHSMLVSLNIVDTPVGYTPPYGQPIWFTVTYNHRESTQPSLFAYSNLGEKWTHNWLSLIQELGSSSVKVIVPGGGAYEFQDFDPQTGTFARERTSLAVLVRTSENPPVYELSHPDGSKDIFAHWDGVGWGSGNIFLSERHDPQGNVTALAYDSTLRLVSITDALGRQSSLEYNETENPLLITGFEDPFGRRAEFFYNQGRLGRVRDVLGLDSEFSYKADSDFIETLTTPYGTTTFTTYENGRTRRLTATDPHGNMEVLEFNEDPWRPSNDSYDTLPEDMFLRNSILNARNSYFWTKKAWRELPGDYSAAHQYHWLHSLNYTQATTPLESELPPFEGRIWYNYPGQPQNDEGATVVGTLDKPSKIGRRLEDGNTQLHRFDYNDMGKMTTKIDPLGRTTRYVYSADGLDLLEVSQDGVGLLAAFTYSPHHLPLTATDAAGQTTVYSYNANGQPTSITNALGETTTFDYYSEDSPASARKGKLAVINGPLPGDTDRTTLDYDQYGNPTQVAQPDGYVLSMEYDAFDRLLLITFPDGTTETTSYDRLDIAQRTDRLGRATTASYNALRQQTSVTDPLGRTTSFQWCKCGGLKAIIDAMGRSTTWKYDAAGRETSKIYADGSRDEFKYSPRSGRLASVTDWAGRVRQFTYFADDSIAGSQYSGAHENPNVTYTYDPNILRPMQVEDGVGVTSFSYHPAGPRSLGAGQLASIDGPFEDDDIVYTYDALGRRSGVAVEGSVESWALDPLGRVSHLTNPMGVHSFTYHGASKRTATVSYPNTMSANFDYEGMVGDFQLKELLYKLPDNTELARFGYAFDASAKVTRWRQELPTASFASVLDLTYDEAGQLVGVQPLSPSTLIPQPSGLRQFSYDRAGNRVSSSQGAGETTASYNPLNQILNQTGGEAASIPPLTYEWDARNRLIAIAYPGTTRRTEIQYDAFDRRRIVRELDGVTILSETHLVWDGLDVLQEREIISGTLRRYFSSGMRTAQGGMTEDRFFVRDHLGSVWAITDATGQVAAAAQYGVWGGQQSLLGSMEAVPGFTGHHLHGPSGLVLAPYRSYAPWQGRWINRDPIGEQGGLNLYQYVLNNPVTLIDPDGAEPLSGVSFAGSRNIVVKIKGDVYVNDLDGKNRRKLFEGEAVYPNQTVSTDGNGRVRIKLDGKDVVIGSESRLFIHPAEAESPKRLLQPREYCPDGRDVFEKKSGTVVVGIRA